MSHSPQRPHFAAWFALDDLAAAEAVLTNGSFDMSGYALEQLSSMAAHLDVNDWLRLLALARTSAVITTSLAPVDAPGATR